MTETRWMLAKPTRKTGGMIAVTLWIAAGCAAPSKQASKVSSEPESAAMAEEPRATESESTPDPADAQVAPEPNPAMTAGKDADPARSPSPASAPTKGSAPGSGSTAASQPADDCDARIVSRMKPCASDPDPCGLHSGWDGDEYCLLPPPAGEGIQIHFGPKSYHNKADTDGYALDDGAQDNTSVLAQVPLDTDRYWNHVTVHIRPSVDHWTSMTLPSGSAEGFYPDTGCGSGAMFGAGIGGGQNLIYDNPPHGVVAPENEGIVRKIPGNSSLCLGLLSYNFTGKRQLREAWVNVYFADEPKTPLQIGSIGMIGEFGINLPPGQQHTYTYSGHFSDDGRIIQLFGHRLRWTPRMAVWLNDQLIYDSRQPDQLVTYNYDSITKNPAIDPAGLRDGAVSGILPFKASDVLKYSCVVDNRSDQVLQFKNDVQYGEMCNLWGATVGGSVSGQFQ